MESLKQNQTSDPRVGIVILNWNNAPDTIDCLSSVDKIQYDNYFVIVVDNGSTDGSPDRICQAFPDIEILSLETNSGYAVGNNKGINKALSLGADFIFILNNDTLVSPSCLKELISVASSSDKKGMVGPKMYYADPSDLVYSLGSSVLWKQAKTVHRGMFQKEVARNADENPEKVDFISGCGVLVSKQLIHMIGGFDEYFFLNYEDAEWGIRAQRFGLEVWYIPKAVIWHKVSSTLGIASPANTYYMTRNSLRFFWMNSTGVLRWYSVVKIVFDTLRINTVWMLRKKYRLPIYNKKRGANMFALRDFFTGHFGKMRSDVSRICYGELE
jgi:GT2 family glycosyltransferase